MRNKLFQESSTKTSQEIEELRRICCEETKELRSRCYEESDKARHTKLDELSIMQQRNPQTVSQLSVQIKELQEKANSMFDAREFHDLESASTSGASHVTSHFLTIPSSRTVLGRDSGLPPNTRDFMGISGNVFERLPAHEGHPRDTFEKI